jgi:hypothetical protein
LFHYFYQLCCTWAICKYNPHPQKKVQNIQYQITDQSV